MPRAVAQLIQSENTVVSITIFQMINHFEKKNQSYQTTASNFFQQTRSTEFFENKTKMCLQINILQSNVEQKKIFSVEKKRFFVLLQLYGLKEVKFECIPESNQLTSRRQA